MNAAPERKIVRFYQSEHNEWIAELECGHTKHVRHNPPWRLRPWILTPEGRESMIGTRVPCPHCLSTPDRTA